MKSFDVCHECNCTLFRRSNTSFRIFLFVFVCIEDSRYLHSSEKNKNMKSIVNLRCPFHVFVAGGVTVGVIAAIVHSYLTKKPYIKRIDVDKRFTDVVQVLLLVVLLILKLNSYKLIITIDVTGW